MAEQRPPQEELVETRLGVERVTAGEAVVAFEVEGRQNLPGRDERRQAGRDLVERPQDGVADLVSPLVPRAVAQCIRRVLDNDTHDVGPVRGPGDERRVGK